MGFAEFVSKVEKGVRDFLGEEAQTVVKAVRKNNGIVLEGLTIHKRDSNLSPTIYLNSFYDEYEKGKTLGTVIREITEIYGRSGDGIQVDVNFFGQYEKVKERIFCKLIHYQKNEELLNEVPYRRFLDLAIVCYYSYSNEIIGNGTITVYQNHLQRWNISEENLFENALKNTREKMEYEWLNMKDVIKNILREELQEKITEYGGEDSVDEEWKESLLDQMVSQEVSGDEEHSMYVLTNINRFLGSVCIVFQDILEEVGKIIGTGYYILPSSIHELILLPMEDKSRKEQFSSMVKEINVTQVEAEEVLSDSIYYYDRCQKKVLLL